MTHRRAGAPRVRVRLRTGTVTAGGGRRPPDGRWLPDGRHRAHSLKRTVPLTDDALAALSDERSARLEARLAAGGRWRQPIPGLCFTTTTGKPVNGTSLTHRFERALIQADLPAIRWHHLRHAFAGLMLGTGAELATVSHLLGHSSVTLTAHTYACELPSLKKAAADQLGRLLQRPG